MVMLLCTCEVYEDEPHRFARVGVGIGRKIRSISITINT